jgi:hypothetical protein
LTGGIALLSAVCSDLFSCSPILGNSSRIWTLVQCLTITSAVLFRDAALKSRIPVIENTIESVKTEQSKYLKHGNQTKREIKAHTDRHDITEMLLKVVLTLSTIKQTNKHNIYRRSENTI